MATLLKLKNLCWKVFDKTILHDISFAASKGEIIGIIGPNGAGKTSLLRCITNQQSLIHGSVASGSIALNNKNITHYSAKELAQHFGIVAQKTESIFSLSVLEIVKMGLLPHKRMFSIDSEHDEKNIRNALEKVGLLHEIKSIFNCLSGGEQQRVLIARALVQNTEILILDEPTNHLDVYYQHQILRLIKQLNITVIMTVHDLNLASQYCHRLLLLNQGKLIADGSADEVLTSELLSVTFGLPCYLDKNPITNSPRVLFYLDKVYLNEDS